MRLPTQLPFGIICILFTHCARVTAVCPTLPCEEIAPVYAVDNAPLVSGSLLSAPAGESPAGNVPVSSTTPTALNSPAIKVHVVSSTPPAAIPSTSSTPSPVLPPTTTSSTAPTSIPSLIPSAATPTSTPSAGPTVVSSPWPSTGVPTVTPPSILAASSTATSPVTQSTAASYISSAASSSSASATVPASITQCGNCRVLADQVQVYYWPTASVKNDCARGASINPFQTGVPYASNASRIQALATQVTNGPTAVLDGHTFTFPSLYVSVVGGISVSDSCGLLGSVHTNPAPVAVQAITTASYANWPSTCRPQGLNAEAVIDTLALSDLACPTWGLSNPFTTSCDGSTYLTATYGEPYNPVILVPTELMSIDPAWGACTTNTADALLTLPCGIYDPPKTLQTATALVPGGDLNDPPTSEAKSVFQAADTLQQAHALAPSVTPVNDPPAQTALKAEPADTGSPSLPKPTTVPSSAGSDPSEDPSKDVSDPNGASDPADILKLDPLAPSTKQSDDPGHSSLVQPGAPAPTSDPQTSDMSSPAPNASDDHANSDLNSSEPDSSDGPSQNGSPQKEASAPASESQVSDPNDQPAVPQAPTTINLGGEAPSTQGLGAFINGALGGGSAPAPSPAPSPAFTPHAITALGQTLSITDPSAVAIAGSTLSVGGPAHTSDGKYYSLAPSGNLIAGTLAPIPGPSSPPVLSVAGSKYTANAASQFVVAGQTLTPGGQITVASTPISLHPSADVAVVGGSTQVLTTPAPSPDPAVLKFAGSTYTADAASQFVVAGQTLSPGGQIRVASTLISLAPSANVAVIGTSTQSLATAPAPLAAEAPVLTWDGSAYTADASSDFVIASQTLTPGGIITVLGTPIRLAPGAADAVIGTSTQSLAPAAVPPADVFTLAGQLLTANPSGFAIAGTTVLPGGSGVTVSGTPVRLESGGTLVVGNGSLVLPTQGPGAGVGVFEGGQGKRASPRMAWFVAYTIFGTFLGACFFG